MSLNEELGKKWKHVTDRSEHIFTWTGQHELAYLAEQASRSSHAIEMGVYMGRSCKVMLDANPNLHLWAVDPFMVDGTFETTRYFLREEIAQGRCEIIRKFTIDAAPMLQHMKGRIDLVFIDAAHDFGNVVNDIKHWVPLIRPDGIACGHDLERNPENDVTKAVRHCFFDWWTEPVPRIWQYIRKSNDHFH